jgi:hypothetical protein
LRAGSPANIARATCGGALAKGERAKQAQQKCYTSHALLNFLGNAPRGPKAVIQYSAMSMSGIILWFVILAIVATIVSLIAKSAGLS